MLIAATALAAGGSGPDVLGIADQTSSPGGAASSEDDEGQIDAELSVEDSAVEAAEDDAVEDDAKA